MLQIQYSVPLMIWFKEDWIADVLCFHCTIISNLSMTESLFV